MRVHVRCGACILRRGTVVVVVARLSVADVGAVRGGDQDRGGELDPCGGGRRPGPGELDQRSGDQDRGDRGGELDQGGDGDRRVGGVSLELALGAGSANRERPGRGPCDERPIRKVRCARCRGALPLA